MFEVYNQVEVVVEYELHCVTGNKKSGGMMTASRKSWLS
jgi:hypothetical protein